MIRSILIIDPDEAICPALAEHLQTEGFHVRCAQDHRQALHIVNEQDIALILLDNILRKQGEMDLCLKLKELTMAPIMLVIKPINPQIVAARIKAHLQRQQPHPYGLTIDAAGRKVYVDGVLIPLSKIEFDLLYLLAREPTRIFSADELFQRVWNSNSLGKTHTVTVHISNLRKKIETNPESPKYILTIWGRGYKFNKVGSHCFLNHPMIDFD